VEDALPRLLAVMNRFRCHCFAPSLLLLDDGEDFFLAEDEVLHVVDLDLGSGVLADEDAVALLDVQGKLLAVLVDLALARRRRPPPPSASPWRCRG
jgi:hypothetical protein